MPEKRDSIESGRDVEPGRGSESGREPERRFEPGRAEVITESTAQLPEVDTGTGWPEYGEPGSNPRRGAAGGDDFYDRPARRTGGRGCLLFLAGFVVLVVLAGLGIRFTLDWPHLRNPFGSETIDRSEPTLLMSIQDLSRFEAASGNFQVIVDLQKDRKYIPNIVFSDRALFVAVGTVDAYVDFSRIGSGAIKYSADHKTVEIHLPVPALEPVNLDESKSYVVAEQRGLWNRLTSIFTNDPNKMRELYRAGAQKINEAAQQSDLAGRAADNTRKMLEQLLRSLGYSTIKITFANP
jgi:hypothetical protein